MADLYKETKNKKVVIEDLQFLGVGQNIGDTTIKTTRKLRVEFKTERGTLLSFRLYKEEVEFIKQEILKWEQERDDFFHGLPVNVKDL